LSDSDNIEIGNPFAAFGGNDLISGFDVCLELKILLPVPCTDIFGPFEHHVFKHMGNTGFPAGFERRTRPDGQAAGHLGRGRPVHHEKEHAVFKGKLFYVQANIRCRVCRQSAGGKESGQQDGTDKPVDLICSHENIPLIDGLG